MRPGEPGEPVPMRTQDAWLHREGLRRSEEPSVRAGKTRPDTSGDAEPRPRARRPRTQARGAFSRAPDARRARGGALAPASLRAGRRPLCLGRRFLAPAVTVVLRPCPTSMEAKMPVYMVYVCHSVSDRAQLEK